MQGLAGRLHRAFQNHLEGLVLFTAAVATVVLGGASNDVTTFCAWTYLIARVAYIPAYASGVPFLRSIIWGIGFFATVMMLIVATF